MPQVTELLLAWRQGDDEAFNQLIPLVHDELRRIARRCMAGERPGHTLQATALVNEAYLLLVDTGRVDWQDRAHFLAMSARLMRRVLVNFARAKRFQKRGGSAVRISLTEDLPIGSDPARSLIAIHDALDALERFDPRKCRVVECRFFGGLSVDETAEALGVSSATVLRDWALAKAWLSRVLRGSAPT